MSPVRRRLQAFAALAGAGAMTLSLLGATAGAQTRSAANGVRAAASGGTVTFAEGPGTPPNYIFPLDGPTQFSQVNISDLQYLLYRPLYWFGNNNSPTVDFSYSIANKPVFSNGNKTVTITLKPWVWSDGEPVSARDVVFWMNLLKAETANWGAYSPGGFPDNVVSTTATSPTTVVMQLDKAYSPTWFLYNELSQVNPLPLAWDRTSLSAPAPTTDTGSLPDTTPAGAKAVYTLLDGQSKISATWASSPIWSVVDGPFRLTQFTNTGGVTLVPNPKYSGSPKPTISSFVELPFTTDSAEYNLLLTGSKNLTIGAVPLNDAPQKARAAAAGYQLRNDFGFSYSFFPMNENNPIYGPVFKQLYFRQAFAHLVNQPGWVKAFLHGYASPTYGPVPLQPPNSFSSPYERSDPYPFNIATAKQILSGHGWKVQGGVATCTKPGAGPTSCGAGVTSGLKLSFNLDYQAGVTTLNEEMQDLQSDAAQVGIKLALTTHPFSFVTGAAAPCKPSAPSCKWTMENWGAGWIYSPDFYPSGEELFSTGALANYESWSDPTANALINKTTVVSQAGAQAALTSYENYIAKQVPVVFIPTSAGALAGGQITAIAKNLSGYQSNVFGNVVPEQWTMKP